MLGAVATDTEIGGLFGLELLFKDVGTAPLAMSLAAPGIRDAVAHKQHLDIAALGDLHKLVVPFHPAGITRGRLDGRVVFRIVFLVGAERPSIKTRQEQSENQDNQRKTAEHGGDS